jgi:hypothetical protein
MDTTPIERVLSRLTKVKKTSNGWDARCPAHHPDDRPSLGVAVNENGRVLLNCRSRHCSVSAICNAIGLQPADLSPAPGSSLPRTGKQIVATYNYTAADGKLLHQVVRYHPKDFRQRRPDPRAKGRWLWNLRGVPPVLYRLPDVLKAVAEGQLVCVVEGEKDVDNLARLGICATTNPGGAGKWKRAYSDNLRGANIAILPDNDDSGRGHAQHVAQCSQGIAASIKVVHLPDLPPKGDVSDWLSAGGTRERLLDIIAAAPAWAPAKEASKKSGKQGDASNGRPTIVITTEEHLVNDQAVAALARDGAIFQRAGLLVRILHDVSPATKGIRRPLAPRIEPLPQPLLRERLAAAALWVTICETKDGPEVNPARPPVWCVAAVHARAYWQGVRHLEAVVDYPVLRPDGTILDRPGYDPETGLLLDATADFPSVPERPSVAEASAARDALFEVVADFPFDRPVHRAAWLAALLTPLARFAFTGPAPLFLVDANVRGAGKGLLLDTIARVVTGERFTIAAYTDDEDELRKRITSLVLAGDRLVLFDNLDGKFGNAVLDAALTGTSWKDRLLGANRMAQGPLYMTWFATGNNVAVAADTARRICHVRLESPEERQDFRQPDLLAWVGENRARLLVAALTILRGYCAAGKPDQHLPAWGSYEGWSALVRSAVVWVGLPDPGETRLLLQEQADVAAESMSVVLACWERLDTDRHGLTAAEVIHMLYEAPPADPPDFHADLRDALEALLGKPSSRALGNKLRTYRRRVFQGRFIDQAGSEQRAARWAVFPATEFRRRPKKTHGTVETHPDGESRESRESFLPGAGSASTDQREVFEV